MLSNAGDWIRSFGVVWVPLLRILLCVGGGWVCVKAVQGFRQYRRFNGYVRNIALFGAIAILTGLAGFEELAIGAIITVAAATNSAVLRFLPGTRKMRRDNEALRSFYTSNAEHVLHDCGYQWNGARLPLSTHFKEFFGFRERAYREYRRQETRLLNRVLARLIKGILITFIIMWIIDYLARGTTPLDFLASGVEHKDLADANAARFDFAIGVGTKLLGLLFVFAALLMMFACCGPALYKFPIVSRTVRDFEG